jgi:hypothetical protein
MTATAALIGHNSPPVAEALADEHATLTARAASIVEAATRLPASVDDDETAGRVADFTRQINACTKALDNARVSAKEPFLDGGRAVDGFFKKHSDPLAGVKKKAQQLLDAFAQRKADAERKKRAEEARLAREEADRLAAAVRTEADLNRAVEQEQVARQATAVAAAKPAEMVRTRGEQGGLVTGRTTWAHEITDIHAIPLETLRRHFTPDAIDAAVRKFVAALSDADKAKVRDGWQMLPGVKIAERVISLVK